MSTPTPSVSSASSSSAASVWSSSGVSTSSGFAPVTIPIDSYSAHISVDTWRTEWPRQIREFGRDASKYVLLTDTNIDRLYGATLRDNLTAIGLDVLYLVLPPGEQTKCRETKAMIEDWMFARQCGRDTVMIAFGGGVMGDLCGYIASTYMRGIPFIQLPTSFLAMVDSSIGGKTGIDTPAGKNLLGAFHRPLAVLIDLSLLLSLPQRELCNGMAESIKAGIIWSLPLFELMESNAEGLLKTKDLTLLARVVEQSVAIKAHVVLNDEKEAGLRSILNFGHSIGHAIEAYMQPDLLHGECVAIGMMEEIILARGYGLVTSAELRRVDNILKSFSLPTRIPPHLSPKDLLEKMSIDKKNKNGKKELVLITSIGTVKSRPKYTTMIPDTDLRLLLDPSIGVRATDQPVNGSVAVPGSKSLSNRILLLAAMGKGPCVITGLLHSQDTQVMLDSLRELGISFRWLDGLKRLKIIGCEGKLKLPTKPLFLNNAGTASRFLTSLVCLVPSGVVTLTGNARMGERPITDLVNALRTIGNNIEYLGREGCLPLKITGNGGLKGGIVKLAANISSQYVSSILLSAPHASGDEDLVLQLDQAPGKEVVSKPFIDMTVQLMRRFNIDVREEAPLVYRVKRGVFANPPEFQVEGDASSATYPLTLAAITGGTVTVENVGSNSLQGDAQFAVQVLRAMGCTVAQTETTTTVRGPDPSKGEKLTALTIDMDAMTDTFMTLAAAAVFADGTTRITGVANQRVKECNRLAVMVDALTKLGVQANETPTGMDIVGISLSSEAIAARAKHVTSLPHSSAVIACHDDHRIAMSLCLVGVRIQGVVLDEKRCVDKTYPEFWEDLVGKFGVQVYPPEEGVVPLAHAAPASLGSKAVADSIILVGMRGSGKTTLGRALAAHLHRSFVDLDQVLEEQLGMTLKVYVEKNGWPTFRAKEFEVLEKALKQHAKGCVISCGGGVVETPVALAMLKKQRCVIQLRRDIEDVVAYLASESSRPGFNPRAAWETRKPLYKEASTYEFNIVQGDADWKRIEADFFAFVARIVKPRAWQAQRGTFFLCLTMSDLVAFTPDALRQHLSTITRGADAIEIRVDIITPKYEEDKVTNYLAHVRAASPLPLIYTVRSKSQGGNFVDYDSELTEADTLRQLQLGFRLGCDFIDIEAALSQKARDTLYSLRATSYPHVRIIASHHEPRSNGGTLTNLKSYFELCARSGGTHKPDVVKVVVLASDERDALRLTSVATEVEATFGPGVIALAMGAAGKLSRVANRVLTPVTHPLLPSAAAPGQMSIEQIMVTRRELGMFPFGIGGGGPKKVLLFGSPVTHSQSPLLHNTAFAFNYHAPTFEYTKLDTTSIGDVRKRIAEPDFYGANVTIPLKEAAVALVQTCSEAVKTIGALNTITKQTDGTLHGDNTDYAGAQQLIEARLPTVPPPANEVAVVIGAGGTARACIYALQKCGFASKNIVVFNRTREKAVDLARHFNVSHVSTLTRAAIAQAIQSKGLIVRAIVSTVPGSANMRIEDAALVMEQQAKPILLEAAYLPADTALVLQCLNEFGVPPANIIRGLDLLIAQGMFGMSAWIGKDLPVTCQQQMEKAVREGYYIQQLANAPAAAK